jgi:threonylcarbamoyladenosine tRNA methylthiotransferase CDKAL1
MFRFYIENYGCSASKSEAEIMSGLLQQAGFGIVKGEKESDLIILVTCYVKTPTQQRIMDRLRQLMEDYPNKKIIIAGCMPEGLYKTLRSTSPNASMVSTHHVTDIVSAANRTLEGQRVEYLGKSKEVKLCIPKIRENPLIDIVPISSGCNSACSYCCVRLSKGKLFSYPKDLIIKEIEDSLGLGCKEFWLTSQDNASYGMDNNSSLPNLLNSISLIPGNFRVRVGMMNPKNVLSILPDLTNSYESGKIYKFLHLPIQSGNDSILRKMNRGYQMKDYMKIIKEFNGFNVWTDIIVGFPGETDEQFENTMKALKTIRPDYTNVSKFGKRPGVSLEGLEDVPPKVVNERSRAVSELTRQISQDKNNCWIGWEGDVLITKKGKGANHWIGRNPAYKLVLVESQGCRLGEFANVRISRATPSYLVGSVVK